MQPVGHEFLYCTFSNGFCLLIAGGFGTRNAESLCSPRLVCGYNDDLYYYILASEHVNYVAEPDNLIRTAVLGGGVITHTPARMPCRRDVQQRHADCGQSAYA